ncbi:MAG TPA: GDSL-type esterase/lipase family protein [Vicinamibacterales bacterium]|jgi:hypothetical protein
MPAETPAIRWPAAARFARVCEVLIIIAWTLLVARDQYGVAWLQPHDLALDAAFLVAVLGVIAGSIAARRPVSSAPDLALRFAFRTLVIVLALIGAEYVLRFVYRQQHSSGNAGDFVARHGGGPAIVNNSLGFRDREIPPKRPDRYRVAVVGDSFSWGQGIEASERFSDVVGALLGPRYEVFNFGQPGTPDHLEQLKQVLPTSPDFILLQLYVNDFETPQMERPRPYPLLPPSLHHDLEESSLFYDLLNLQFSLLQSELGIVDSYEQYLSRNLKDPASPNARQSVAAIHAFVNAARHAGIPCGIVLFPAADAMGPDGSYPFGYLHNRVRTICTDESIPCVDLLPAFSKVKDPRTMWVSQFDAHPNAMANRRAAQEILQTFAPVWRR